MVRLFSLLLLFALAPHAHAKPAPALGYIVELQYSGGESEGARTALAQQQEELVAKLRRRGRAAVAFQTIPYVFVPKLTAGELAELRSDPYVRAVTRERVMRKATAQSLPRIGQPRAVAAGATGAGFSVAVLDSGVDYRYPDFGTCTVPGPDCRVVFAMDAAPDDGVPDQGDKHGTNVAGIVARTAPQAKIISMDIFHGEGAPDSATLAAFAWINSNRAAYNIGAVNLSIQDKINIPTSPCLNDPLRTAVRILADSGIAVVISSGNMGRKNGVSRPGCIPEAISVGATTDARMAASSSATCNDPVLVADSVTCFSNSASFLTLLAPGKAITAGPGTMAGTSQAAPHVAAAIVALRSAKPGRTSAEALALLQATGVPVKDRINGITKMRISLGAATNVPPVARDDAAEALEGGGAAVAVLANDSDEATSTLIPALIDPPAGISAIAVNQKLYVLTAPGTSGIKTLRYRITDDYGATAEARLTLTVRKAAMPAPAALTTGRTFAVSGTVTTAQRLVQWIEQRSGVTRVWQRELAASGAPTGAELALSAPGANVVTSDLAASGWESSHTVAWLQTFGTVPGAKTRVMATTHVFPQLGKPGDASFADPVGNLAAPAVAALQAGPVVLWTSEGLPTKIRSQAYSGGVLPVPEGPVRTLPPFVAEEGWKTLRVGPGAYILFRINNEGGITAQRYSAQAAPVWPAERELVNNLKGNVVQLDPAPVPGGMALLWSARNLTSRPDVYFQRFDPDGNGLATPTLVCANCTDVSRIRMIKLSDGNYRAFWVEKNPTLVTLMSRAIAPGGTLGPVRIDLWSTDVNNGQEVYDVMPLDSARYQLTWFGLTERLKTQLREAF